MSELELIPGADPPIVVGYCQLCEMPVERFVMDVLTSWYYVGIHAKCCGKTQSIRITKEELFRIKAGNEKLFMITRKGSSQQIRGMVTGQVGYKRADVKDPPKAPPQKFTEADKNTKAYKRIVAAFKKAGHLK